MSEIERTEDGRYIVVDGRRWRASDPGIPDGLREELVAELMSARRAVGHAKRVTDHEAESRASARVSDAKIALGERGHSWWEQPTRESLRARAAATLRTLLRHRGSQGIVGAEEVLAVIGVTEGEPAATDATGTMEETGVIERVDSPSDRSIPLFRKGPEFVD